MLFKKSPTWIQRLNKTNLLRKLKRNLSEIFSVNKKNSHLPNSFDIKSGLKYRNWNSKNLTTYLLFPNGKQPIELEITILFFWFDYTYETKVILCVVFFDRQCLKWKIFEFIFDFAKKNCFSWSSGCTIQVFLQWITFENVLMTFYLTK